MMERHYCSVLLDYIVLWMFLRIFVSFNVCGHLFITLGGIPLYWVLAVLGTMLAFTFTRSLCGRFFIILVAHIFIIMWWWILYVTWHPHLLNSLRHHDSGNLYFFLCFQLKYGTQMWEILSIHVPKTFFLIIVIPEGRSTSIHVNCMWAFHVFHLWWRILQAF